MNNSDYEQEALDYLREEAGQLSRYEKWKDQFYYQLFFLDEVNQPAISRGEIMQVAYDIVDGWDK